MVCYRLAASLSGRADDPAIAANAGHAYVVAMKPALLKILAMLALLWMPFGMSTASAMPAMADHATSEHCSDKSSPDDRDKAGTSMDCTACAALPAMSSRVLAKILHVDGIRRVIVNESVRGVLPEIATPPPKAA